LAAASTAGAAEAVADQQPWSLQLGAQPVRRGQQIADVGRKIGVGELALAGTEPGEVEA
jgi:hypothetical protein